MSKEAMKQMVHELEYVLDCINNDKMPFDGDDFHEALRLGRQAIATEESSEVQEPVAWISWNRVSGESKLNYHKVSSQHDATLWSHFPLYTTPQQRTWVGLTNDEVDDAARYCVKSGQSVNAAIRAIEAKLKEKNT
jgi:hypothetical protein